MYLKQIVAKKVDDILSVTSDVCENSILKTS